MEIRSGYGSRGIPDKWHVTPQQQAIIDAGRKKLELDLGKFQRIKNPDQRTIETYRANVERFLVPGGSFLNQLKNVGITDPAEVKDILHSFLDIKGIEELPGIKEIIGGDTGDHTVKDFIRDLQAWEKTHTGAEKNLADAILKTIDPSMTPEQLR
jgi:hypothetical protein